MKGLDDPDFYMGEVQHEIYTRLFMDIRGVSYTQALEYFQEGIRAEREAEREALRALQADNEHENEEDEEDDDL